MADTLEQGHSTSTETHAQFGSVGTRYEFFTSEGIDLKKTFMTGSTAGSTTLAHMQGSGTLKVVPLNSSVLKPTKDKPKQWGMVESDGAYWGNMTIESFVNGPKDNMYISYSKDTVCLSNKSGTSYKSGIRAEVPYGSSTDTNLSFNQIWTHDLSWRLSPTVYSKKVCDTVLESKNVQSIYPKTKSPRWHRRAGIQHVTSTDFGVRTFFVYTDLLGTFYVYAAYIPKELLPDDPEGSPTPILLRYQSSNDWAVPEEYYKKLNPTWGDAIAPNVKDFYGYEPISYTFLNDYSTAFLTWKGEFSTSSNYGSAFDEWMGGLEPSFKDTVNLLATQYLWNFNYNSTKAVTIAFEKGKPINFKNSNGELSNMYKLKGLPYAIPEAVKKNLHNNALIAAPKLDEVTIDVITNLYPILLECSVTISITGPNPKDFDANIGVIQSKSAFLTNEYYLSAGYTHPVLEAKTGKVLEGNKLTYAWLSCHGSIASYHKDEMPYDTKFKTAVDLAAKDDIPKLFSKNTKDMAFMETLISGNYSYDVAKTFVDSIEGIDSFIADCATVMEEYLPYLGGASSGKKTYAEGKAFVTGSIFGSKTVTVKGEGDGVDKNVKVEVLKVIASNRDYSTSWALMYGVYTRYGRYRARDNYTYWDGTPDYYGYGSHLWRYNGPEGDPGKLVKAMAAQGYDGSDTYRNTDTGRIFSGTAKDTKYVSTFIDVVMAYAALPLFLMNEAINVQNILPAGLFRTTKVYPTFKCFDYLLMKHVAKTQVLSNYTLANIDTVHSICLWPLLDKLFEKLPYILKSDQLVIKDLYARYVTCLPEDYSFDLLGAGSSTLTNWLDSIPRHDCQIIDGVLAYNSYHGRTGYPTGSVKVCAERDKRKIYFDFGVYTRGVTVFRNECGVDTTYGKKITNFKNILNINVEGVTVSKYLLLDTPYVAITANAEVIGTLGMPLDQSGDSCPYSSPRWLPLTTTTYDQPDILATKLLELGLMYTAPEWVSSGWPSGKYPGRFRTNAVSFGLYVKANKTTVINNLVALDLASTSCMFYGVQSNYNYSTYDVGSSLFCKNKLLKSFGVSVNMKPDTIGTLGPRLDVVRFNLIYSLSARIHTIADMPQLQSYTAEKNALYSSDSGIDAESDVLMLQTVETTLGPQGPMTGWVGLTLKNTTVKVDDTYTVTSFITSHPNGSFSAYSLPPIGLLQAGIFNPKLIKPYKATTTIDYISLYKQPKSPKDKPEYTVTTHKDLFNNAFSQKRDYDYYTKAGNATFGGGFATAGVFYDFNIPNQYKKATSNLVTPPST